MIELFSSFKPYKDMPKEDWDKIYSYYSGFFKNRKYPRFFQSYLYLKAERRYFYYGWINDCFVLVKKYKQFGNRIFYLPLPPISKTGNLKKELEIIKELNSLGIKTKVSDEDVALYDLKKQIRKERDNIEHIYNSDDFDLTTPGFKKFRYNYNKLRKYEQEENLFIEVVSKLNEERVKQINHLTENWNKYKKMQADMCQNYFNDNDINTYFAVIDPGNKIVTSSMVEKVYDKKMLITTNYSDYNYQINDLQSNKALHCVIMKYFPGCLINSGSAGWDKGLYAHKKQLKPCKELQIYDTIITAKITEENYNNSCRG